MNELARRYMVHVIAHARRLARRLPSHVAMNDLISAGMLGVAEGFTRFDPSRTETLDAYIDHRIRGALLDELRRIDPLTREQRGFARRLGRASRELVAKEGAAPEDSLARDLGLNVHELRVRTSQVTAAMAIVATSAHDDGIDHVVDGAVAPDVAASAREEQSRLNDVAGALPERDRELLRLIYEEGQTHREIGVRLGVTESRISQLHTRVVKQLRASLALDCDESLDAIAS